jgi:predicted metal-binding protein
VEKNLLPTIKAPWQACVLVCRKCSKKAGGKQGKRFGRNLRNALRERLGKKASRLVEVGCLDLCPKGRIVVGLTSHAAPLTLLLARPDTPPEDVLAALLPAAPPAVTP